MSQGPNHIKQTPIFHGDGISKPVVTGLGSIDPSSHTLNLPTFDDDFNEMRRQMENDFHSGWKNDEFDKMCNDFFHMKPGVTPLKQGFASPNPTLQTLGRTTSFPINNSNLTNVERNNDGKGIIVEHPTAGRLYQYTFDLQEYDPNQVNVRVTGNTVSVSTRVETTTPSGRSVREFNRSVVLPKNVDTEKLVSRISRDGTLIIEAPLPPDYWAFTSSRPQHRGGHYVLNSDGVLQNNESLNINKVNSNEAAHYNYSPVSVHSDVSESAGAESDQNKLFQTEIRHSPIQPQVRKNFNTRNSQSPVRNTSHQTSLNKSPFNDTSIENLPTKSACSATDSVNRVHFDIPNEQSRRISASPEKNLEDKNNTPFNNYRSVDDSDYANFPTRLDLVDQPSNTLKQNIYPTTNEEIFTRNQPPVSRISPKPSESLSSYSPTNANIQENIMSSISKLGVPQFYDSTLGRRMKLQLDVGKDFHPEELVVKVLGNRLKVEAEREQTVSGQCVRSTMSREFELNEQIEPSSVVASVGEEDGRLTIDAHVQY